MYKLKYNPDETVVLKTVDHEKQFTSSDIFEQLKPYLQIPKEQWTELTRGHIIKFIDYNNNYRIGGIIEKNSDGVLTIKNVNETADVPYKNIRFLYKKMSNLPEMNLLRREISRQKMYIEELNESIIELTDKLNSANLTLEKLTNEILQHRRAIRSLLKPTS